MFRGLFIGIDRHASPSINWLSFAGKDAVAMHSLFTDNLGGETCLLRDGDATRSAIKQQFENLAQANSDDFVVISFSGHGTETHELVTYDADLNDLPNSCIPLDVLAGWVASIPAANVLFVLDCCFSGGLGAKALQVEARPRGLKNPEVLLKQFAGDGRIILTATLPTEMAWETQKVGHGLLTYHTIEALQGPEEVVQNGKLSLYNLLNYVTKKVIDGASAIGKKQNPTFSGTLKGEVLWPIFARGPLYNAAFPEFQSLPITEDIDSLKALGFQPSFSPAGKLPSLLSTHCN